jgi:hypothetical protein
MSHIEMQLALLMGTLVCLTMATQTDGGAARQHNVSGHCTIEFWDNLY